MNTFTDTDRQPQQRAGPFTRWPRATDAFLGLLVVIGTLSVLVSADNDRGISIDPAANIPWLGYLLLTVAAISMMGRRHWPIAVAVLNAAVTITWETLEYEGDPSLGVLIGVYSVGRYVANTRLSYGVAALTVAISLLSGLADALPFPETALSVATAWAPWYVGRRVLARRAYLEMLEERAEHLQREQQAEAQRAVEEERTAIARELHDVVAHRVSMMTVQAGAAKTVGADSPGEALEAVAAIEEEGRLALTELRHLLGVLRPDAGGDTGMGPQGAIAQIPDLVSRMADADCDISLHLDISEFGETPSRIGLSVYRIVQESLTNVVKHAGPGTNVDVTLRRVEDRLLLKIVDDGSALPGSTTDGYGIAGMAERAALLGGTLSAGPRRGGGWAVQAEIPLAGGGAA